MTFWRKVEHLLRPPGHVPLGTPKAHAHLARWRHWYGAAAIAVLAITVLLMIIGVAGAPSFLALSLALAFNYLGGWRVAHPPHDFDSDPARTAGDQ